VPHLKWRQSSNQFKYNKS